MAVPGPPFLGVSREMELVEEVPAQGVAGWTGNTASVPIRHFLMTTEDPFAVAVKGAPKAAQNAAK